MHVLTEHLKHIQPQIKIRTSPWNHYVTCSICDGELLHFCPVKARVEPLALKDALSKKYEEHLLKKPECIRYKYVATKILIHDQQTK